MLQPRNDFARRALEPQRFRCKPVQNAIVRLVEVKLCTGRWLAVTPSKVGGDSMNDSNFSTLSIGRRRKII